MRATIKHLAAARGEIILLAHKSATDSKLGLIIPGLWLI